MMSRSIISYIRYLRAAFQTLPTIFKILQIAGTYQENIFTLMKSP